MRPLQAVFDALTFVPRWLFATIWALPGWITAIALAVALFVAWRIVVAARKVDRILLEETTTAETSVTGDVPNPAPVTDHDDGS